MWGWILAGVLWVTAGPFVFKAVRDPRGGDGDLMWFFCCVWPIVVLAAWFAGAWQRIRR